MFGIPPSSAYCIVPMAPPTLKTQDETVTTYPTFAFEDSASPKRSLTGTLTLHSATSALLQAVGEINGVPYEIHARYKRRTEEDRTVGHPAGEWTRDYGVRDLVRSDVTFGGEPTDGARKALSGPITGIVRDLLSRDEAVLDLAERQSNLDGARIRLRSAETRLRDLREDLALAHKRAERAGAPLSGLLDAAHALDAFEQHRAVALAQVSDYTVPTPEEVTA